ncbi:MAG: type II secretion system F family protein [Gammaproteobacteria bacterium]
MPFYSFTARDSSGRQVSDTLESTTRDAAVRALRRRNLLPLRINEIKQRGGSMAFSWNPLDYRSIAVSDVEQEFHQIAVMLRSGISLLDALNMTARYSRFGARMVWERLARRVQQGSSFQDALSEHAIFTPFTLQLIRVGEQTGHLSTVMDQAAEEMKSSRKIRKQVVSALKYPSFTLLFAIGIVIFMLTTIIPEIKKLLLIMGRPMPPLTQSLIDVSDWFLTHGIFIAIAAIAAAAAFVPLYHWPPSRWWIDRIALYLPVIGHVLRLSSTVLFSRAMGLLLKSGVVIVEALDTMENLHVNRYAASRVKLARTRVMQGSSLAEPLEDQACYMPLMIQMLRVGESSGTLDEVLKEMTEYHEELLHQAIARLTGMIAPTMTILVGGIIGFVYAAFLVAMFSAAGGSPS